MKLRAGLGALALVVFGDQESCQLLVVAALRANTYKPSTWYQEYPAYPEYCSIPSEMDTRGVPPLPENDPKLATARVGESRLVHVTAVIRHGARTPWSSEEVCWEGYWDESSDTSVWDCDLTTVMAPPDPNQVFMEEEDTNNADWLPDDAFFMFEKRYDALHSKNGRGLTNLLHGTCQCGQMLMRGYEQELRNGRLLREAYAYLPNDYDHDERMRLIDLSLDNHAPWDPQHLYYRSDDDQRTEMSGQVLLRGLFDEEVMEQFFESGIYPRIKLHTADRNRDILTANSGTCPRSALLQEEAMQSEAFQVFNSSDQMEALRWFARDKLGVLSTEDGSLRLLDCLMTTICTDRNLPHAVDDYHGGRNSTSPESVDETMMKKNEMSMFEALAQADIQRYNLLLQHNNAEAAKLAMGPLWAEIMGNINPYLEDSHRRRRAQQPTTPGERALKNLPPPAPQLALFSGHDTTIIPLLTSLGPRVWNLTDWPPYASMVLIEVRVLLAILCQTLIYRFMSFQGFHPLLWALTFCALLAFVS